MPLPPQDSVEHCIIGVTILSQLTNEINQVSATAFLSEVSVQFSHSYCCVLPCLGFLFWEFRCLGGVSGGISVFVGYLLLLLLLFFTPSLWWGAESSCLEGLFCFIGIFHLFPCFGVIFWDEKGKKNKKNELCSEDECENFLLSATPIYQGEKPKII